MPAQQKPSRGVSVRNRVRYRFDNLLSRGTWAALLFLAGITLAGVLAASVLMALFSATFAGSEDASWLEDSWQSLMRVLDPGTMADDVGWGVRFLALLVTVFGILVAGTLIGLVATGIEQRVSELRRGRSTVVESGHIVILGASSRLPVVIEQLALANRRRRRNVIVVLAKREPDTLWDDVRAYADSLYSTHLVFRWGDPTRASDLAIVNVQEARAVIVLSHDETDADAGAVTAVLATGAVLGGFDRMPIVVDMDDPETAESLARACGGAVHPLIARQAIARIMAFALRQPGLSGVVGELLGFRGCDIYLREVGDISGLPFGETVFRYLNARPIGRMRVDGSVEINPDPTTRLDHDDRLIFIAEDERTPTLAPGQAPESEQPSTPMPAGVHVDPGEEHVLIIGWSALGTHLLRALGDHAAVGSSAEVIYDSRLFGPEDLPDPDASPPKLTLTPKRRITWPPGALGITGDTTAIVLLGSRRGMTLDEADSQTLLRLMMVRRELEARGGIAPRVVVEVLDADNVELVQVTGADDYVVSDALTSRLMAQYAEQPERRPVLLSLYATDGPSIRLLTADDLELSGARRFDQIVARAYASGLLALGWRFADGRGGDVVLNPDLDTVVQLAADDQIIVIG